MSWKTTACGICSLGIAVLVGVKNVLDGDPATSIDVASIVMAAGFFFPALIGIYARDNDKSSEDVGVK